MIGALNAGAFWEVKFASILSAAGHLSPPVPNPRMCHQRDEAPGVGVRPWEGLGMTGPIPGNIVSSIPENFARGLTSTSSSSSPRMEAYSDSSDSSSEYSEDSSPERSDARSSVTVGTKDTAAGGAGGESIPSKQG
jgi:hypothetical protein